MNNDDGFDLGFEFDPMYLAATEFLAIAQDVGEIQSRADKTMRSTISGERQRVAPIASKASLLVANELAKIEGDVRAIEASVPAGQPASLVVPGARPGARDLPPIAEPLPPVGGMPPVVAPGGGRAFVVMTRETCGPDGFTVRDTLVLDYVDGKPVNPPPGYTVGPVYNQQADALAWARAWVESNPRTPCGEPPAPPSEPPTSTPPATCPPPTCLPVCGPGFGEEPKTRYCVWIRREPPDCIVQNEDNEQPPGEGYHRISCHASEQEATDAADWFCKQLKESPYADLKGTTGEGKGSYCDSNTWTDPNKLNALAGFWANFNDKGILGDSTAQTAAGGIGWLFGAIAGWLGFGNPVDTIQDGLGKLGETLTEPGKAFAEGTGCGSSSYEAISLLNMVMSIVQKWIGTLPPASTAMLQYSEAWLCPWLLPSASEAERLFFSGVIDEQTATNLGRLNGRCDDTTRSLLDAGQSRFDPSTILSLYWRGLWDSRRAAAELRARGYTDDGAFQTLESASRYLPGPTDVLRFLIRDVADLRIVQQFDLDAEFRDKFDNGDERIRKYAESQGIDREVLEYYWRAHWTIPSPTQLGTFWQRLRPGRTLDSPRADRIGLRQVIPEWSPRANPKLVVDEQAIKDALAQQDILPFWRDKFLAVQFNPLTRVDARRAYDIGVLTVDDVYESLIQDGYREEDALVLTEFATKEKNLGIRNTEAARLFSLGLASEDDTRADLTDLGYSPQAITNFLAREIRAKMRSARALPEFAEFVSGNVDEPELRIALEDRFYRPDQVDEIIESAKRLGRARFRGACTSAAKTRFLWGELDADGARKQLIGFGWSVWAAEEIVNGWKCELAVSDRLPTVRQLLNWIELGVINAADFRERMRRLLYSDEDIDRFLAQAIEAANLKAGKAIEKAIKEQEARIAKERAAAQRAAAKAAREGEKRFKAAQVARSTAEKLALALNRSAVAWAEFAGIPFEQSSAFLTSLVDALVSTNQLTLVVSTSIVVRSVEWAVKNEERDLATVVDLLATNVDITADVLEPSA